MMGILQRAGGAVPGHRRAVGERRERLPAAGRPHPEPGEDRRGRGQLREVDARGGDRGPGRASARCRPARGSPTTPAAFAKWQASQDQLSGALSRLLVVVEAYPDLKATANFRDLQAQLEGTENRITWSACATTRPRRRTTPSACASRPRWSRGCSGFKEKAYFQAPRPGRSSAPHGELQLRRFARAPAAPRRRAVGSIGQAR